MKKAHKSYLKPPFSNEIEDIIFGGLLGDLNLQTFTKGKTWRLRVMTSFKFLQYIQHLEQLFLPWIKSGVKHTIKRNKVTKRNYKLCSFNTLVIPSLVEFGSFYYNLIPSEGKKYLIHQKIIPPKNILMKRLTPRAIAYWLMDDGAFYSKTVLFCTNSFQKEEVNILREVLYEKYNIETTLRQNKKKQFLIYVRQKSFPCFKELVLPYVLPLFKYKIGEKKLN